MEIADTIMERPHGFSVGGRQFYLYPVTIGKMYLIGRLFEKLDANDKNIAINPYMEAMRLCETKVEIVCRLLVYHTFNKKEELFDNALVSERIDFFVKELSMEDMAQLLVMTLARNNVSAFIKHFGIDKEKETQRKIAKVKEDKGNTFTFGGKSIYGSLIDVACERYGWTMDYVVWGISYDNLQMLLADSLTSICLTDEERKKVRVPRKGKVLDAGDPKNIEKIMAMNWD